MASHLNNPLSFRELLDSDAVTPATSKALAERIRIGAGKPLFFDEHQYLLLQTVCDLLSGQPAGQRLVNIAAFIDDRLVKGLTKGWRYDTMPPDARMYSEGLKGIEQTAAAMFNRPFLQLDAIGQIELLRLIQSGNVPGDVWKMMPPAIFFEELLAEVVEIFYAHPAALEEINYIGMADAHGWQRIGLNEIEFLLKDK